MDLFFLRPVKQSTNPNSSEKMLLAHAGTLNSLFKKMGDAYIP